MVDPLSASDISKSSDQLIPTFEVITAAQQNLRSREEFAIDSSRDIAPHTRKLFDSEDSIDFEDLNELGKTTQKQLHHIRKVSEIYENRLQVRLPTGPIYRAALNLGKVTTLGGIIIALHGVHETATEIANSYRTGGKSSITEEQVNNFYFASGILIGELVLMATPFSSNFAFQATGRLHSRLL